MYVLSIKVPIQKKSGNLFNDPCIRMNLATKDLEDDHQSNNYLIREDRKTTSAISTKTGERQDEMEGFCWQLCVCVWGILCGFMKIIII